MNGDNVTRPHLRWALRTSFRQYVKSLPDGRETVGDGARLEEDGRINFPPEHAETSDGTASHVLGFAGSIAFEGHAGVLDVKLHTPRIDFVVGGRSTVSVMSAGSARWVIAAFTGWEDVGARVVIAEPRLSWAGASVLGGVYEAGDLLDPIEIGPADA